MVEMAVTVCEPLGAKVVLVAICESLGAVAIEIAIEIAIIL